MEQFTLSSSEIVSKQNMSETIICNHVALINPEEKWINVAHKGIYWAATHLQLVLGHKQWRETHAVT